jgi:hypothetical protein
MVWTGLAEDVDHARQCGLGAGAHVQWINRQPQGVDADHRNSSRIQADKSMAALIGQLSLIVMLPRRSSTSMERSSTGSRQAGA